MEPTETENRTKRQSTLALIDALRTQLKRCPQQGTREQMLSALGVIQRLGFTWMWREEHGLEQPHFGT